MFSLQDLYGCYPAPLWVMLRIRDFPQKSVGNALRDPLPVPFTSQEVRNALRELYLKRKTRTDRNCAPVIASSVQIALQVLPILERRNGGWIDFDAGRPTTEPSWINAPAAPRPNVFNLRCLLYRLPGKPLPPRYQLSCSAFQPRRLSSLYNIRDVRTTFAQVAPAPTDTSPRPSIQRSVPQLSLPRTESTLGHELEALPVRHMEPFTYSLFEVFGTFDIKEE